MNFKIFLQSLVLLTFSTVLTGQQVRELFLEDIDADNDISIEMETNDPQSSNYRHMILGCNTDDEGFIKMLSNNDLSFWTNGFKRMTIENNGNVGIGTSQPQSKLHVKAGRIAVGTITTSDPINQFITNTKTGLDFYTSTNYIGGLSYSKTNQLNTTPTLAVENKAPGFIKLKVFNEDRMVINSLGEVTIADLASNSTRRVRVDGNGKLTVADGTQFHNISPSMLTASVTFPSEHGPNIIRGVSPRLDAFNAIDLPEGAVITRVRIFFVDDSSTNDVRVRLARSSNGSTSTTQQVTVFESSGSPSTNLNDIETATENVNWTIGPSGSEKSHIFIDMDHERLGISSIILDYQL